MCRYVVSEGGSSKFPPELHGGLWHTTPPDRYLGIVEAGHILPDPPVPESERWKTSRGPEYHPYVRALGGVSLFDFQDFDPDAYNETHPMSSWAEFVPCSRTSGVAMWLQIDRFKVSAALIGADALVARWKEESAYRHTIMPRIEAAHLGPLPLKAVLRVLRFGLDTGRFEEIAVPKGVLRT